MIVGLVAASIVLLVALGFGGYWLWKADRGGDKAA